jgi:hypothetical protein
MRGETGRCRGVWLNFMIMSVKIKNRSRKKEINGIGLLNSVLSENAKEFF